MSDEIKLKPCQQCGGEAERIDIKSHRAFARDPDIVDVIIRCTKCRYEIRASSFMCNDAVRIWNTRPVEDAQAARIAELEKALRDILNCSVITCEDEEYDEPLKGFFCIEVEEIIKKVLEDEK